MNLCSGSAMFGWRPVASEFEACPVCGYLAHIWNGHKHTSQDKAAQDAQDEASISMWREIHRKGLTNAS